MCKQNGLMCKQNGLLKHGSTYFFQVRITKDCKAFFPKAVIREKLTATTGPEAKAQVRQKWADLEATFDRIRATGSPYKHTLTEADAQHSRIRKSVKNETSERGVPIHSGFLSVPCMPSLGVITYKNNQRKAAWRRLTPGRHRDPVLRRKCERALS